MPPDLVPFTQFGGEWEPYEDALYKIFTGEIAHGLKFRGQPVNCRRMPESHQRWASFWHLIQEGRVEDDRLPDLRRCERLSWVRWVVENWNDPSANIDWWENDRRGETSVLLWYNEEYIVVLAKRDGYWLLKTAFETHQAHRVASFRRERDNFHA